MDPIHIGVSGREKYASNAVEGAGAADGGQRRSEFAYIFQAQLVSADQHAEGAADVGQGEARV